MNQPTFLCLASYYKGTAFLKACHDLGIRTILLTLESLKEKDWPWEYIDEHNLFESLWLLLLHELSLLVHLSLWPG